jgi:Domain of unknown function (DUF5655)
MITKSNPIARKVSKVTQAYSEEQLLLPAAERTRALYYEMKKYILELGRNIEVRPTKVYIGYRRNKGFANFVILKNVLKIYLTVKKSS